MAGGLLSDFPDDVEMLAEIKPVFEEFPGWQEELSGLREFEELPDQAKRFLEAIARIAGIEVALVSVGPDRDQTLIRPGMTLLSGRESTAS